VFARMITYTQADPSPHRLEEGVRRITETFQWVRQLDGIEGAYYFVDRKGGKVITITLWESRKRCKEASRCWRRYAPSSPRLSPPTG